MRNRTAALALLGVVLGCSGGGGDAATDLDAVVDAVVAARADARADVGAADVGSVDIGVTDAQAPDAEPAPPVELRVPTPGPWVAYPEHPFRDRVDATGTFRFVAASLDGAITAAAGDDGLALFQVDARGKAALVSRLAPAVPVTDLALSVDGRTALLAVGRTAVVVELAEVRQPVERATFDAAGPVTSVALSPDARTALVATDAALFVVDLRDPAAPTRVGSLDRAGLRNVVVAPDGRTAFASDAEGLVIIDLEAPDATAVVGRFGVEGRVEGIAVSSDGATLFVTRWEGVSILDVRERAAPALLSTSDNDLGGSATAVVLSADDRTMFVSEGGLLRVVDVHDPRAPSPHAHFEFEGAVFGLGLPGDERALVTTSTGVFLLDLQSPGPPPFLGRLAGEAARCWQVADVQVSPLGETAFVVGRDVLMAIDVADPRAPALLATAPGPGVNLTLSTDGQTLLVAGERVLDVFDVHDPARFVPVGSFDQPSADPMDVVLSSDGTRAYLATEGGGGLDIVDLQAPGAAALVSHLYIRHTESIVLSADEQTVFVADSYENGLLAIDVRDPSAPAVVGRLAEPVHALALSPDGTTLVATRVTSLLFVDVRDPASPVVTATFEGTRAARDVSFAPDGKTLLVADGPGGLRVIDLTVPNTPRLQAVFDTPGEPADVALMADGTTAIVTAESASACVTLVDVGHPPTLEPVDSPDAGALRFRLHWTDRNPDHPEHIAWHTTGGDVVVSAVDQRAHTALVDWTPPVQMGNGADAPVLSVAVGNHHAFEVAHAAAAR
jgi:hypothetical protein